MNLEQLIDHFELITDTESGRNQLKRVTLEFAFRGKLLSFKSNINSKTLIEKELEKQKQLEESGQLKYQKTGKKIGQKEKPFAIPQNWNWARLCDVVDILDYKRDPISKKKRAELNKGKSKDELYPYYGATQQAGWINDYIFDEDLVLLGEDGAPFLDPLKPKAYLVSGKYWVNNHAHALRGRTVSNEYLKHYLTIVDYSDLVTGSTRLKLNQTKMAQILVPVAPIEEQQRIVQKIETLFSQVDELEQKVRQDREVDERLQVAVLDDLQRAYTPEASRQSWQRITDHFELIYRKPEHINQLEQAILNEAVRGRLVPQDPNDEPAEKLLERIKEEKKGLYEEGEIRKRKDLDPIKEKEIRYELPDTWCWSRLGNLVVVEMGQSPPGDSYNKDGDGPPLINGPVEFGPEPFSKTHVEQYTTQPNKMCKKGDFLICVRGSTTGRTNIAGFDACIGRGVAALKPLFEDEFVRWCIVNLRDQIYDSGKGSTFPSISKTEIANLIIPLPPLNEQKKIIKKIDELFSWCDDLKEKLSRSQQTDQRLLEALVNGALEDDGESKESKEATIYQMPEHRVRDRKLAKVSGMSTTDVQAGIMARVINGYERYSGKKEHLGRTKMEKTCHIIESHAGIDLGRKPKRMQFGSADYTRLRNKVEPRAKRLGWFNFEEDENGVVYYKKGTRFHEPFQKLGHKLINKSDEIDRIIELFVPLSTRDAEVRQTVYAAWHDLLAYGKDPTNDEIVMFASTEKYWAKEKENIRKKEFFEGIQWLKENNLVPDGRGKLTLSNKKK